jgi:UPF0755 protein
MLMEMRHFRETPMNLPEEGVTYILAPGSSFGSMARELEQLGYIESSLYLRIAARFGGIAEQIKAGEYFLSAGTTPDQLLGMLVSGSVVRHSFTLVEGWTFRQVLDAMSTIEELKQTVDDLSDEEIMERLGHSGEHPEGRFLADTYHFSRGMTDLELLQRAYDAMTELLQKEWPKKGDRLPLKNSYEAIILASIVEKETALVSERPRIAGLFLRRLSKGMKLQTDPTVIYGMGENFDGNIRRRDLLKDTPYNTYVHTGLTPTPISNPGKAAILAVLNPMQDDNALYFVAKGDSDGSHYFSATLKEHNRAVRKYQLKK